MHRQPTEQAATAHTPLHCNAHEMPLSVALRPSTARQPWAQGRPWPPVAIRLIYTATLPPLACGQTSNQGLPVRLRVNDMHFSVAIRAKRDGVVDRVVSAG